MANSPIHAAAWCEQEILDQVKVGLLDAGDVAGRQRYAELITKHHYLKNDTLVGEQLRYVAEVDGRWLALLSWSAAANHLKDRQEWIGWNISQRRRRLALVANNARFLILPGVDCPNLASRVLANLDAEAFERVLIEWQLQRAGQNLDDQIAIDGKAQRGSTPHVEDEQKPQLVSAQSQPSGRVLGTVAVEEKSNEIAVIPPLGRPAGDGSAARPVRYRRKRG